MCIMSYPFQEGIMKFKNHYTLDSIIANQIFIFSPYSYSNKVKARPVQCLFLPTGE